MTTPYVTGFAVPTLDELIARKDGDLNAQLSGIDAYIPGSDEWVLARVQAAGDNLTHGLIQSALREWFPDCATDANLERIGARYAITRNAATATEVTIQVTATAAAVVPIGTLLIGNNDVDYLTTAALVFAGPGAATVNARSTTLGAATALTIGATLNFATPAADINQATTVTAITGGTCQTGVDIEDLEDYRARILQRIASVPQGGAAVDYERWALDVDGVERVWVHVPPTVTRGHVRVVFVGSPAVGTVDTALELVAPVTAIVDTVKATDYGVAVEIQGKALPGYSEPALETAVGLAIQSLCEREGGPLAVLYNSQLRSAIGAVEGLDYFIITDCIYGGVATGSPNSNATAPYNQVHAYSAADMVWLAWL